MSLEQRLTTIDAVVGGISGARRGKDEQKKSRGGKKGEWQGVAITQNVQRRGRRRAGEAASTTAKHGRFFLALNLLATWILPHQPPQKRP